ncbi:MAG TPA: ATP-binding protein [Chloroflexota bacterium]|nr:ATP-binding protein [Chloroflexota bacterium]
MRLRRRGFVVPYVALALLLVVATALAVGVVFAHASGRQAEGDVGRRLAEGAQLVQTSLDETRDELAAVGRWLQHDRGVIAAIEEGKAAGLESPLSLALAIGAVDELDIADRLGQVVGRFVRHQRRLPGVSLAEQAGFQRAISGLPSTGFAYSGEDFLTQEVYLPISSPDRTAVIGALRLASFVDQAALDRFRRHTGLDAALFVGERSVATTSRTEPGPPLTRLVPAPNVALASVMTREAGRSDQPGDRIPARFVPLDDLSDLPIGAFSVSVPVGTAAAGLGDVLRSALQITVAMMLAGAALAYLLACRVQQPLRVSAEGAARVRDGGVLTPMPTIRESGLDPLAEEPERARHRAHPTLKAIADAEERQRALFSALREPVLTTSAEGRITSFNPAARELLGDPIFLYGRPLDQILPFVDVSAEEGDGSRWHGRITTPEGVARDVEVVRTRAASETFPLTDIYVIHDVTEHVELGRMREQLLYSVAHEVRGPIGVLDNVLDILAHEGEELAAGEQRQLARSARSTVARLHNVIESLLSAGSIQSGRFEVHPEPTWLSQIIDEAVQAAMPPIEARNQRVEQLVPPDDLRVMADGRYVCQLLWNLLSNASKYGPDGDLIRLRAEAIEGHVRVTIEDHGPGIPIEQQHGLFGRFYRTQSGAQTEGIGLGLAIAKAIVDAHGGTIGVDSAPGEGTRVWFTLPLVVGPAD